MYSVWVSVYLHVIWWCFFFFPFVSQRNAWHWDCITGVVLNAFQLLFFRNDPILVFKWYCHISHLEVTEPDYAKENLLSSYISSMDQGYCRLCYYTVYCILLNVVVIASPILVQCLFTLFSVLRYSWTCCHFWRTSNQALSTWLWFWKVMQDRSYYVNSLWRVSSELHCYSGPVSYWSCV